MDLTAISFLNLFIALEARYVLCDALSNWCRLLAELKDDAAEFVDVR